ncbi:MAG: aldehyde ferredoxin oxidoreductase family protein [Acidimicrobiia bacterium]|nr:aldehyde ferredoxin oxidoreductase family protein [Acidimicrobiia bacterium]
MPGGYHRLQLRIDLASRRWRSEPVEEQLMRNYIGGNGFAAHFLFREVSSAVDALTPENLLVLATGPWCDTPIPGSSRACIAAKSPLTGIFYDSTFGGRFPVTLKRTGFDLVLLANGADEPTYLLIAEGGVEFRSARELAGRTVRDTVRAIRAREGDHTDVLAIGPAGENRVRFAGAGHYWQNREGMAGRGGIGAVMGAKNLKAIAVRGAKRTPIAAPDTLDDFLRGHRAEVRQGTVGLTEYGTPMLANFLNALGALGTRNLARETWDQANQVSGERMKAEYWEKNTTCFVCPVACGKDVKIKSGRHAGTHAKIPEWETVYGFGPLIENSDIETIIKAGELCDMLGLDTITMGVTLAFAYDCFERGILTAADVGRPLHFGDPEPILDLVRQTAAREGIGELLAEGSARMAARLGRGAEKSLLCVKGLEIPGHSARALKGMSVGYATGTRGGSHHDARPTPFYVGAVDRFSVAASPGFAVHSQNFTAIGDSLVQCRFVGERGGYGLFIDSTYAHLLRLVTGHDWTTEEVEAAGERIYNLERCFNVREGIRRRDDHLPYKVMHEAIPDGPSRGMYCSPEELQSMLDEYYRLRGWDANGVPMTAKLESLRLADAAAALGSLDAA